MRRPKRHVPFENFMTSKPLTLIAALCALIVFPQVMLSANCPSTIWSTRQTRVDGPRDIRSLQTVDVDRDGKLDLVGLIDVDASDGTFGELSLWHGLGDGTFAPPVSLGTTDLEQVSVADINNDGIPDLVMTSNYYNLLIVRFGNGTGFDPPISQDLNYSSRHFAVVHFNGDVFADVVTMDSYGTIAVNRGDGHGHFTESRRFTVPQYCTGIVAADFDGDGLTDIAYSYSYSSSTNGVNVAFQNADGSFGAPLVLPTPTYPTALEVGDLDEDGLPDLVTVLSTAYLARDPAVLVYRNLGNRHFDRSDLSTGIGGMNGNVSAVHLYDVNGDNHLDIVAAAAANGAVIGTGYLFTYAGKGDGTFRSPTLYATTDTYSTDSIALGDFDGDQVPDLALGAYQHFVTARSTCATQVFLYTASPVITLGQSAPLRALVSGLAASTPLPRGTVTFREGMTTLGSADVDATGLASLDVSGLSLGNHTVTATFAGNSEEGAGTSQSIVQNVITGATTTTIVFPQAPSAYGTPYTFNVVITSQYGSSFNACYILNFDGVDTRQCSHSVTLNLSPGQHTLTASFPGDTFYPPSTSGPQTFTTAKATPGFTYSGDLTVRAGNVHVLKFSVTGPTGTVPTGTVQLMRGNTLVTGTTVPGNGNVMTLSTTLALGEYDMVAVYSGDTLFKSASINLTLAVVANAPLAIHARGLQNFISIRAVLPANTTSLLLSRRVSGAGEQAWQPVNSWSMLNDIDNAALTRGVLYDYRLDAAVSDGSLQSSNIDTAMLFTDDPIVSGTSVVRRTHFEELRLLINSRRAIAGLAPFTFDSTYVNSPVIRAGHLASLRAALAEMRLTLGMEPASFTNAATPGSTIKAIDLIELRQQAQ
jgi:hypothetical protein